MDPLGELVGTNHREALEFFLLGLRDLSEPTVDPQELVYNASVLAHYAQVSTRADVDLPIEEALYHLLVEESLATLLVLDEGDDRLVHPLLQHDLYLMGSDGIYHPEPSRLHPRVYGSAGRVLGPLARDAGLFSLEDAVYKLSHWKDLEQRRGM